MDIPTFDQIKPAQNTPTAISADSPLKTTFAPPRADASLLPCVADGNALALVLLGAVVVDDEFETVNKIPPVIAGGVVLLNVVFAAAAAYSGREGPVALQRNNVSSLYTKCFGGQDRKENSRRVHNTNHAQLAMHPLRTIKPNWLRIIDSHNKHLIRLSIQRNDEAGIESVASIVTGYIEGTTHDVVFSGVEMEGQGVADCSGGDVGCEGEPTLPS